MLLSTFSNAAQLGRALLFQWLLHVECLMFRCCVACLAFRVQDSFVSSGRAKPTVPS